MNKQDNISASWLETKKNERGFYVFTYRIEGDSNTIKKLSRSNNQKQIKVENGSTLLETWVYYGRKGIINYLEKEGRFVIISEFYEKVLSLKKEFGFAIYSGIALVTGDMNWRLAFFNSRRFIHRSSDQMENEELQESARDFSLSKNKRFLKIFDTLIKSSFKHEQDSNPEVKNIWHLAAKIHSEAKRNQTISFQIIRYFNYAPFQLFSGWVMDDQDNYFEINLEENHLFFSVIENDLNLQYSIDWESKKITFNTPLIL